MRLSIDVVDCLLEDPIVRLLLSLVCRGFPRLRHPLRTFNIRRARRDYTAASPDTLVDAVVKYCHIDIIYKTNVPDLLKRAAQAERLDLLENYCLHRGELPAYVLSYIAFGGHLNVLKWCYNRDYYLGGGYICNSAARGGHLELLQWCRGRRCSWSESTCRAAAAGGHLALLQYCRSQGCPWDRHTCSAAAAGGHLILLRWCREQGCSWTGLTCARAARGGHLEVLQWCRANNCPWSITQCLTEASRGMHTQVLEWIRAQT
jgi:hypothetical protein